MADDKFLRVLTVEVASVSDDKDEHWKQFRDVEALMTEIQEIQNAFFDHWRAWHFENGSAAKIKAFHQAWKEHAEAKRPKSERPKLAVHPYPPELGKRIYHFVTKNWPTVHTRPVVLVLNRLTKLVTSSKSAKGSWPAWHSWLLFRQQIPMFTHPCPIPIDPKKGSNGNFRLEIPSSADKSHVLHCTIARKPVAGQKTQKSVTVAMTIRDRGKPMRGRRVVLGRIASGEFEPCGSQLFIKDNKLFAALSYYQPKPARVSGDKTAVVAAMPNSPLRMRADGRSWRIGGDGRVVATIRRQLMGQRWSRQQSYRVSASSARKGRGRRRAMDKVTLLSNRWRDFVRTYNRNMAVEICKRAIVFGCGVIVVLKRSDDSRWLARAGKFDRRDKSSWDWYALEKTLCDKAVEFGLHVEFVNRDDRKSKRDKRRAA